MMNSWCLGTVWDVNQQDKLGLRVILDSDFEIEVVGVADDGAQAALLAVRYGLVD